MPAKDLPVKGVGFVQVAGVELIPCPGPHLVYQRRPFVFPALKDIYEGALCVLTNRYAAGILRKVHNLPHYVSAGRVDLGDRLIGTGHVHVAGPRRGLVLALGWPVPATILPL